MARPGVAEPEILSKDSFGASHPLGYGSLCNSKGLGCNSEIADNVHVGKEIPEQ